MAAKKPRKLQKIFPTKGLNDFKAAENSLKSYNASTKAIEIETNFNEHMRGSPQREKPKFLSHVITCKSLAYGFTNVNKLNFLAMWRSENVPERCQRHIADVNKDCISIIPVASLICTLLA